jgi:nucleotide-binding universal stress UspA family protein
MIQRILLATDGSASAERAADFAASLGSRYGAKVTVLHVYSPAPSSVDKATGNRRCYSTSGNAKSLVMNVAEHLREAGVPDVDTEISEGPVASAILNSAKSRKPDLLVLGARGSGASSGGMLLGSVTMAVTYRAECPVLVVK